MTEADSCFEWDEIKDPVLKSAFKKLDRHIHDTMQRHNSLLNLFNKTISSKRLELALLEVKRKELIEILAKEAEKIKLSGEVTEKTSLEGEIKQNRRKKKN